MSEPAKKAPVPGLPLWMATFADMMALMMTFFVLLFAFSEVEQEKFKQMAGSMAQAFGGVQYIKSNSQDNIPGMEAGIMSQTGFSPLPFGPTAGRINGPPLQAGAAKDSKNDELMEELKEAMSEDIAKGDLILERDSEDIVIRFPEHVSFASGSANLVSQAPPLIARILTHIRDHQMIIVAGHTDNRPLGGGQYKSNWNLSAARAASVAEQMLAKGNIEPERLVVAGYADTRPIASNDTAANRTRNRRVEIIVKHIDENDARASTHRHVVVD
ncbi:MAG: flagellar motor protein MotB [Oceanococcus sp.]